MNSDPGYSQQGVTVDGASSFLLSLFGSKSAPRLLAGISRRLTRLRRGQARSSVDVAGLPVNITVEGEMIVEASGPMIRRSRS